MSQQVPDYSIYHLHELEAALKNVDESANPDEARLIRGFIAKGGYKYPVAAASMAYAVKSVSFIGDTYKNFVTGVIWCLLLFNVLTLVSSQNLLALLPIAFQGSILAAVYLKYKYARLLIKIWCGLLIVSGASGFVSMYFSSSYSLGRILWCFVTLAAGIGFLLLANRYVHLVLAQPDDAQIPEPPSELAQ